MSGQYWPEGDEVYHAELTVPVLLVHGMHDKFVPVEEDQRMAEVGPWHQSHHTHPRGILPCAPAPGKGEVRLRVRSRTWGCRGALPSWDLYKCPGMPYGILGEVRRGIFRSEPTEKVSWDPQHWD